MLGCGLLFFTFSGVDYLGVKTWKTKILTFVFGIHIIKPALNWQHDHQDNQPHDQSANKRSEGYS
jgi:hypothetical protein